MLPVAEITINKLRKKPVLNCKLFTKLRKRFIEGLYSIEASLDKEVSFRLYFPRIVTFYYAPEKVIFRLTCAFMTFIFLWT